VVDVITSYSTDGRIAAFDLAVLSDPRQAFPPYDAILLVSPRTAAKAEVLNVLLPLINSVTDDMMRSANKMVDVDGLSVERAAASLVPR